MTFRINSKIGQKNLGIWIWQQNKFRIEAVRIVGQNCIKEIHEKRFMKYNQEELEE